MTKDIFITSTGQTPFAEHWDKGLRELMDEALTNCLDNSPCTGLDIDMIVVSNMLGERTNDQAQLGALASSLLPHHPPALRAEAACGSGAVALHTAVAMLESGRAETILVLGVEKMTDVPTDEVSAALMGAADSEKDSPSGITFPGIFGLIASRYMHEYGLSREELNLVSAKHHEYAAANPNAQFRSPIPAEKISESPCIADPLCLLDCSPVSDGAAAVLLSTKFESPLRLAASQLATDTLSITERAELTSFAATRDAARSAYDEADLEACDLECIELHDCFSIAAIINCEDLGLAEPGRGIDLYKEHSSPLINASGGLKACGHPVAATGIKQIGDVCKKLTEKNLRYGLAHNFGGAGATCGVHIVERVQS